MKRLFLASIFTLPTLSVADTISPPPYSDMQGKPLSSVECLAVNLYHESRGQSDTANIMVISTVLNRVEDRRYPDDICEVVFQNKQYAWTSDGKSDEIKDLYQYRRLYRLSEQALMHKDFVQNLSQSVTHYHSTTVNPYWVDSTRMEYVSTVDDHKFYRWVDKPQYIK